MKELHVEGLATHDDPESFANPREGVGEAFDRGTRRQAIEPRNHQISGADAVTACGRPHGPVRYREHRIDPARSETPGMRGNSMSENREILWLPGADGVSGRSGKAKAVIR